MERPVFSDIGFIERERGFVLVTSLVLLSLLTLMSLGMFYSSRSAIQVSSGAQRSTEAYYYSETAINYISWALAYDADFDSFDYSANVYQHGAFAEPPTSNASINGDYREWGAFMWNPGATVKNSDSGGGIAGQVKYFDNSPMKDRAICFEDVNVFSNCIDTRLPVADRVPIVMFQISVKLPRYIKLEIASDGSITPSIPKLPHRSPSSSTPGPIVGEDIPNNGAVVWLTAVDPNNPNRDIEIFPLDPTTTNPQLYGGVVPSLDQCISGGTMADCPCNKNDIYFDLATTAACDAHGGASGISGLYGTQNQSNGQYPVVNGAYDAIATDIGRWTAKYGIVAYAIGYVNGRPSHLIRSVIR